MLKKCIIPNEGTILFDGNKFMWSIHYSTLGLKDLSNIESAARQFAFTALLLEVLPVYIIKSNLNLLSEFVKECYDGEYSITVKDFYEHIAYVSCFKQGEPIRYYKLDCYHNLLFWSNEQWSIQFYTTSLQQYYFVWDNSIPVTNKQMQALVLGVLNLFNVHYVDEHYIFLPKQELKLDNSEYDYFKIGD